MLHAIAPALLYWSLTASASPLHSVPRDVAVVRSVNVTDGPGPNDLPNSLPEEQPDKYGVVWENTTSLANTIVTGNITVVDYEGQPPNETYMFSLDIAPIGAEPMISGPEDGDLPLPNLNKTLLDMGYGNLTNFTSTPIEIKNEILTPASSASVVDVPGLNNGTSRPPANTSGFNLTGSGLEKRAQIGEEVLFPIPGDLFLRLVYGPQLDRDVWLAITNNLQGTLNSFIQSYPAMTDSLAFQAINAVSSIQYEWYAHLGVGVRRAPWGHVQLAFRRMMLQLLAEAVVGDPRLLLSFDLLGEDGVTPIIWGFFRRVNYGEVDVPNFAHVYPSSMKGATDGSGASYVGYNNDGTGAGGGPGG